MDSLPVQNGSLVVESSAIWDVRVFLLHGNQPVRLGMVRSNATTTLTIAPQYLDKQVVFYVEGIGVAARSQSTDPLSLRTESVYVRASQTVRLKLESRLRSYSIDVH